MPDFQEPDSDLIRRLNEIGARPVASYDLAIQACPTVVFHFGGWVLLVVPMEPSADVTAVQLELFHNEASNWRQSVVLDLDAPT